MFWREFPFECELPEGWAPLDRKVASELNSELKRELCPAHSLFEVDVTVVAQRIGFDDFLFVTKREPRKLYVVHLTWSKETSYDFPWTTSFLDAADFNKNWRRIFD